MARSRRHFLWLAGAAALMSGTATHFLRQRATRLETVPIKGLPGYFYLEAGPSTGGLPDPFFGLDGPRETAGSTEGLFERPPAPGLVPVACFSDYNCAYCRVLTKMLVEIPGIDITWHELPLLGESSVTGARAALAARMQDAYWPMHTRLMRSGFRINEAYLRQVTRDLGLDSDRLLRDMESPEVDAALALSARLAALFGIYGTPALVVRRVLVLGNINRTDLTSLVEMEHG
ncbi:MAG: DsbA family protein [Tropicimonas sp.]|uniref:DsbA family protein n=1 Tax=Tropicimonas sp. TaxID=2067044 RepID=UPI003A8413CB